MWSWICLRHIEKSFRFPRAPRTIGHCACGKPFEYGIGASRFVWKRETAARGKPESSYKKSGRATAPRGRQTFIGLRKGSEILLARPRPAFAGQLLAQTKAFDNLAI